ncbi:MAG TPA: hypothetical protein GX530_00150 [Corynebacteriales bacterium]|nr:hypothetical protein [Mycobacteriales bacterium]
MSSEKKGGVVLPLVLIFLFTVAVVLVGIELYARHQVGNDIAKQVSAEINKDCIENAGPDDPNSCARIGVPVKTRFSAIPILFSVPQQKLPQIEVRIGVFPESHRLAGTAVKFDAKDVDYTDKHNIKFGSAEAELHIPPVAVRNQLNAEIEKEAGPLAKHMKVSAVKFFPEAKNVRLELNEGLIKMTVVPNIKNGKFVMELTDTEIAGSSQPFITNLLRSIIPNLAGEYMNILPTGFVAEELEIKENEMIVKVNGKEFTSQELAEGTRQY